MTDKQKTTQEEPRAPFEGMPFAAMMKQMMTASREAVAIAPQ